MGKPPIAKKKMGSVELALWQGEFEGKTVYSYTIQKNKFNKKTEKWETSNFFTPADMPNLLALVQDTVLSNIKKQTINQQQQTPSQQTPAQQVQQEFKGQDVSNQGISEDLIPF